MKHWKLIALLIFTYFPIVALAQVYQPMVKIPGITGADAATQSFNEYINALYALSIAIAALLAVIKIVIAGVKWMLTDIVTSKEQAKKDITAAIFGLVIVIAAVLILFTINPNIINSTVEFERVSASSPIKGGADTSGGCNLVCQFNIKKSQYAAAGGATPQTWPIGKDPFEAEVECTGKGGEFYNGVDMGINEHVCLFPPLGGTALPNINEDDVVIDIPAGIPENQREEFCESRTEELCELSNIGCYVGDYYNTDEGEVCVIQKENAVALGEEMECDWIGTGPKPEDSVFEEFGGRDTDIFDWDCTNAEQVCTDAGMSFDTDGQIDSLTDVHDLTWLGNRKVTCEE